MTGDCTLPSPFTIQCVGGPVVAQLSFSLERKVAVASQITGEEPVPAGFEDALRRAYADTLVVDHGAFATAWSSEADSDRLLDEHDRFVAAIRAVYAPARIALLRSSIPRFYWARTRVRPRSFRKDTRDVEGLRRFLERLDNRFREATGCAVVDGAAAHLPTSDGLAHKPGLGDAAVLDLEDAVLAALRGATTPHDAATSDGAPTESDGAFAEFVRDALLSARVVEPHRVLEMTPEAGLQTDEDVAALAAAVSAAPDAEWTEVARKALPRGGVVRARADARLESNRRVLRDYPHVYVPGGVDFPRPERLVSRVHDSFFLVVQPGRPRSLLVRNYGRRGTFDVRGFCDGGYVCRPDQIDQALESWEAYFERGRRGLTTPFRIAFPGRGAFRDSLEFLDYAEILANESYCLTVDGDLPDDIDWHPRVDSSFLFDPLTRVCMLGRGFGDQIVYYVTTREVADAHGLRVFLDDLWYDHHWPRLRWAHARPDLLGITKAEGVFSELFSRRLRHRRRTAWPWADDRGEYAALGLPEQVLVMDRSKGEKQLSRQRETGPVLVIPTTAEGFERCIVSPPDGVPFIYVLAREKWLAGFGRGDKTGWERAISWRGFESEAAAAVGDQMLASDAVVVHVRRGDRALIDFADPDHYYRGFLERIAALEGYPHKRLFVFSDDLDYCRQHPHELGLDLLGDAVTFVEGNRHFASIDDFHLMSLGKVIVCGLSGFSAAAALVSTRVQHIFGEGYGTDGGDTWHRAEVGR